MEEVFIKNGYLVQGCYDSIHVQTYKSYIGVGRYVSWPLFYENDTISKMITEEAEEKWIDNSEISAINNKEFIKKYLKVC